MVAYVGELKELQNLAEISSTGASPHVRRGASPDGVKFRSYSLMFTVFLHRSCFVDRAIYHN